MEWAKKWRNRTWNAAKKPKSREKWLKSRKAEKWRQKSRKAAFPAPKKRQEAEKPFWNTYWREYKFPSEKIRPMYGKTNQKTEKSLRKQLILCFLPSRFWSGKSQLPNWATNPTNWACWVTTWVATKNIQIRNKKCSCFGGRGWAWQEGDEG